MGGHSLRAQPLMHQQTLLERLSEEDVRHHTTRNAFSRGESYWRDGRVLALDVDAGGTRIKARVLGSRLPPYSVTIQLAHGGYGGLHVSGHCTCPVGVNCKHMAAALLAAIAEQTGEAGGENPSLRQEGGADGTLELLPGKSPSPPAETLAPNLAAWIDLLSRLEKSESEDYPEGVHQRLLFVLAPEATALRVPRLVVTPTSARLLKNGTFSHNSSHVFPPDGMEKAAAKFLRPSDRDILRRLRAMERTFGSSGIALGGEEGASTLEAAIATGRARWGSIAGPVVTRGPARQGRIAWRLIEDGSHCPDLEVEGGTALAVRLAPPWYADLEAGVMGPVETGFAPCLAEGILSAPPIPPRQSRLLRSAMAGRLPGLAAARPPEAEPPQRIQGPPIRGLRMMVRDLPKPSGFYGFLARQAPQAERLFLVRPFFRYGAIEVSAGDVRERPTVVCEGRVYEIVRDRLAERRALAALSDLGFERLSFLHLYDVPTECRDDMTLADDGGGMEWVDFLYHDVPELRAEGWEVEVPPEFPIRLLRAGGDVLAELREGTGIDWFELDLGVLIDGERVDLVPAVLAMVTSPAFDPRALADSSDDDLPLYLPLSEGRVLAMPLARLRPILASLHELFAAGGIDAKAKRLGFTLHDATSVAEVEEASREAGVVWRGGERLREIGRRLREATGIASVELPADFGASLRPYQARGVEWLQFLREVGLGGVLADDMGLGKTVQALAHLAIEKASGRLDRPALVITPTSVVANWRREAERFAPALRVLTLHGLERKSRFAEIVAHDLVLTTYPLLSRDHATLKAQDWHVVILDEAQVIKNPDAATTRFVNGLTARHRLCLTGTPLENHLGELWSLFAFLSPGFLGDRRSFQRNWRTPIEKKGDGERRKLLARRIRPFLLRRTKGEVAVELPPKTEILETVEMGEGQRQLYESIRLAMHEKVRSAIAEKGLARSRIVVLDALLKLRQVCCDPRLLKLATATSAKAGSAKLERLMEMLPELVEEGRRVLLFSQFTSMLALIEEALGTAGIDHVLLTGDTRDRETPIRRFQSGEVPLFLISLKAGGLGLNLTAADTVIHYDPWWNPAVEDQATDRAHRLGQVQPVFVHKLMMAASVEEKIEGLKARKRELAAGIFDAEAGSPFDLTESDIEDLFGQA